MARRAGAAVWRRIRARPDRSAMLLLASLSFLPMVLTARGQVSADTKTYLTLDPGRLLSSAVSMWDPSVGAGTVPHQNIGYLFPLGPYYWLLDAAGFPDWIAQRLLWGLLIFSAAAGTLRLLRWLGWSAVASLVAAGAYGFSPYLLSYLARLSAILFPWAALPWLILLAARAARERSWFRAAQFAVVVALAGSVNATSLLFVGLGPVIWLIADAASGRVAIRSCIAAAGRIGLLCAAVSAWWIAGLRVQGIYGLPILDFTESYQTVASASTPPEILRGLGYWFFYGGDRLDPWIGPAFRYFNDPAVMFLSFGLTGLALLGLLTPFRGRLSMMLLFLTGLVLSVGAAPLGGSTWYGTWWEQFATDTTAGAALRSTPRAAPLLLLALACGLGAGVETARRWLATRSFRGAPVAARAIPIVTFVAVLANLLPWFSGNVTSASLLRPETLPGPTIELAEYLNSPAGPNGRVYTIPGADFADYRWGGTVDPVLPGLTDRSVLYRELIPQGGPGTADLLNAFERRLSEGWFEPATLPVVASLFGVDTIVVRNDLQHERYRLARPGPLWTDVTSVLGEPDHAGPLTTDQTRITLVDEITLAHGDAAEIYPITAAFEVGEPDELTLRDATAPMVLVGSGDGIIDLAATGLYDPNRVILYAADTDPAQLADATSPWWVITDSNRKQGRRWSTIGSNLGALESVGPLYLDDDPNDNDLALFELPNASTDDATDQQTIAVHLGPVADVAASSYGSAIVYTAEDAPPFAIDGDPATAWRAAIAATSEGVAWTADFAAPEQLAGVTLLQPQIGANDRFVTRVRVTVDGGSIAVDLDDRSRNGDGQFVDLATPSLSRNTNSIEITVLADNVGDVASYVGQPGVGFAEIVPMRANGAPIVDDRTARLPLASSLAISATDRLTYLFTRQRIDPATPNRQAPEPVIDRQFDVPAARDFDLSGDARLSPDATDAVLALVTASAPSATGVSAVASTRLPGSVDSRGAAAVDGDVNTSWQTPFDAGVGASVTVSRDEPTIVDEITITWIDDGRHARPLRLAVIDGSASFDLTIPDVEAVDGLATATIPVAPFTAASTMITITDVSDSTVPEYYSGAERQLPIAIAEIGLGAPNSDAQDNARIDTGCQTDFLMLDGAPLPVRVNGSPDDVLTLSVCDGPIRLDSGPHRLVAAPGRATGIDLDRLVLDTGETKPPPPTAASPPMLIDRNDGTEIDATIPATSEPFWLVLAQSRNDGWIASVDGIDLGPPSLIDGYANGWLIPSGDAERPVKLRWTPQRSVDVGIVISLLSGLLLAGLIIAGGIRRRRPELATAVDDDLSVPRRHYPRVLVAAALVIGFLVAGGIAAAVSAALVAILAAWRGTRWATIGASAIVCTGWATISGAIIALEWRYDYANGPDWPLQFDWAAPIAWAVVAAITTCVVQSTRRSLDSVGASCEP